MHFAFSCHTETWDSPSECDALSCLNGRLVKPVIEELLTPMVLIPWLCSMAFGIFVGATPGLTATMAVALIVPFSFRFSDPSVGLAMIIGVSFTAIFAGDIPATWLRIPGTPASAAATLDGHALALKGRGGFALLLDLICSCLGGLVGVALLILLAQPLAPCAPHGSVRL